MHDYVKNLAKVVRAAREEAHLSQAALAEQIGCDERTILNIENDRGNPKFEVLCQIIAYLHIPAAVSYTHLDVYKRQVCKQQDFKCRAVRIGIYPAFD